MHAPALPLLAVMADLNAAAERIWQDSIGHCPGLSIDVLPEVGSTNTALMARARQGDVAPCVMAAAQQTAGRGRQGRSWQAALGDTLTFSLALPLRLDTVPGGGSALSLAVGLSVAQALASGLRAMAADASVPIGLKWPNDLYLNGLKLGGILIEATPAPALAEGQRWVVIGLGLNVRQAPAGASALWTHHPACGTGVSQPSIGQVWSWLVPALIRDVQQFERAGFAPLQSAYAAHDVLQGQTVDLWTTAGHTPQQGHPPNQTGLARGLDATGALLVHTDNGPRSWTSGDVSVRLQPSTLT